VRSFVAREALSASAAVEQTYIDHAPEVIYSSLAWSTLNLFECFFVATLSITNFVKNTSTPLHWLCNVWMLVAAARGMMSVSY